MASGSKEFRGWRVEGRVQGVGFRWSTARKARSLGVSGWVRNEPDGTVRVRAHADAGSLDALEEWLYRGPRSAEVSDVVREEARGDVSLGDFEIRHR